MAKSLTVLLATDGSPQADVAARLVGAMRWPQGTTIEILRADEPFASDAELPPGAYDALRASIREQIDAVLLGSVARNVVTHAPCSVLVVRRMIER